MGVWLARSCGAAGMQIIRNLVLDRGAWRIIQIDVRNPLPTIGDVAVEEENILVLPVAGVFARHDGPRHRVIGTSSNAVFIDAGAPYRLSFPGGIGDRCLTIRFPDHALARATQADRALKPNTRPVLLPSHLLVIRNMLWARFRSGGWDDLELEELSGLLVEATLRLAGNSGERHGCDMLAPHHAIEAVTEAVAVDPARKWTLAELGRIAHVSPYHLARRFRQKTGVSIYDYVLRARLALALDLLTSTRLDLTTIGLDTGFSSHSHFTARFRSFFGMTPTAFRQTANTAMMGEMRRIVTAGCWRHLI